MLGYLAELISGNPGDVSANDLKDLIAIRDLQLEKHSERGEILGILNGIITQIAGAP
jgi:hypothetical protein